MGVPLRQVNRNLGELRELIKAVERPVEKERYTFSMVPGGLPRGAIIEMAGVGKTEVLARFLGENPKLRVAWVEDDLTIYPCALAQRKVSLKKVLFVEAGSEVLWATLQILRSHLFDCVVLNSKRHFDEKNLRRLQLESEKGHLGLFLLTDELHQAWPISVQLKINGPNLEMVREKA